MCELGGSAVFSVDCADGSAVKYDSVEDVLKLPNAGERRIERIRIATTEGSVAGSVSLKDSYFGAIAYDISGPQRDVFYVAGQLEDCIAALRQWYSPIASANLPVYLLASVITMSLSMWLFASTITLYDPGVFIKKEMPLSEGLVVFLVLIASFVLVGGTMFMARKYLFPVGIFACGDGKNRYDRLESVRLGVAVAFLISLLASIAAGKLLH